MTTNSSSPPARNVAWDSEYKIDQNIKVTVEQKLGTVPGSATLTLVALNLKTI